MSKTTAKHNWRTDPAGPKQRYWIEKLATENVLGIALKDQAMAALADEGLTKGAASDLMEQLFKTSKNDAGLVGQGVYLTEGQPGTVAEGTMVVTVVKPNQKFLDNPKQAGANLYSMSLVPAPGTNGKVRYELVYDPEARSKLTTDQQVKDEAAIADILAKCPTRVAKTVRDLL